MLTGGLHLIIDGEIKAPLSPLKARSFLRHFPRYIEMHRFTDPMVYSGPKGLAGIVGIAESHIAVHTVGTTLWLDVFSCKGFETERAVRAVVRLLGLVHHAATIIPRPMPLPAATPR